MPSACRAPLSISNSANRTFNSVLRSHMVLDRSLRTSGVGRLKFGIRKARSKAVWDQLQMDTIRSAAHAWVSILLKASWTPT